MNYKLFEKWLTERQIRNIPPHTVFLIDNDLCHDVDIDSVPASSGREMKK
jgi:hypothetical protein